MKTQSDRFSYLLMLITGIAIVLFSTAGIARMMGWGPNSTGDSTGISALDRTETDPATGEAGAAARCAECGMIVSMREIDALDESAGPEITGREKSGGSVARDQDELREPPARRYEMTIRLAGGSSRVISHESPVNWRSGERVIVIDGANPPNR